MELVGNVGSKALVNGLTFQSFCSVVGAFMEWEGSGMCKVYFTGLWQVLLLGTTCGAAM